MIRNQYYISTSVLRCDTPTNRIMFVDGQRETDTLAVDVLHVVVLIYYAVRYCFEICVISILIFILTYMTVTCIYI